MATPSELEILRAQVELLRECHNMADEALRSAHAIAKRRGINTYWDGHIAQLGAALDAYYAARQCFASIPPRNLLQEKQGD